MTDKHNNDGDTPMDVSSPRKDAAESLMDLVGGAATVTTADAINNNEDDDVEMIIEEEKSTPAVAEATTKTPTTTPAKESNMNNNITASPKTASTTPKLAGFADAKKPVTAPMFGGESSFGGTKLGGGANLNKPLWGAPATFGPKTTANNTASFVADDDDDGGDNNTTEDKSNEAKTDAADTNVDETAVVDDEVTGEENNDEDDGKIIATPAAEAIIAAAMGGTNTDTSAVKVVLTEEGAEDGDDDDDDVIIVDDVGGDEMGGETAAAEDTKEEDDEEDDPAVKAALEEARKLNKDALLSTLESKHTTLQKERDDLISQLSTKDEQLSKQSSQNSDLISQLDDLKSQLQSKDETQTKLQTNIQSEKNLRLEMEQKLHHSQERVDRIEGESDNLRKEIARLTKSNNDYTSILNSVQSEHSKSAGDIIPLRLQTKRLETELQSLTSHSNYLDRELASRNEEMAKSKREHSTEVRELRNELDTVRMALEEAQRENRSSRRMVERSSTELEKVTKKLYDVESEAVEQRELLERDLVKERELIALKEQRMVLAEDQRRLAVREVEELKKLAKEAAEEATAHLEGMQSRLDNDIENAVREVKEADQVKIEELERRLTAAVEAKRRIEEDILNKSTPLRRRRRIENGEDAPLAITAGDEDVSMLEDGGPLSLTDIYTRLAETEDDLRAEQHENKKLKILIERIHRDVAAKTPIFHQKQLELESALDELDEMKERLDYARREVIDVRADNQDLELKSRQGEREASSLKRENVELASQVQSLLQRRAAESGDVIAFCDIQTMQAQNQELVRQHNTMREKIEELESEDSKVELDQLRSEIVTLREEREKQANLVAGIVHQRDLYRALVAKNDASTIDNGADQLALADARAEQLPVIEAKNRDLTEEVSKLRADVSSFNMEKEALGGRLKCLESVNNDLTGTNQRLNGDLVAARAEAARSKIDAKHYQDRCDRLTVSLDDIKSEKDSLSVGKKQTEDLYTKTQTNLDMARSELSKKEQSQRDAISRINRLETDLETHKSTEHRLKTDMESLRNENARLSTLLTSVQRIEASLSAKSESEIENLNEEVKRLRGLKVDDDTKHNESVQKLEGKIVDLELNVKNLTSQKESATITANKANLEISKLKISIQELNLKLKMSEKELNAAKAKLGDVTIDTSVEEKLEAKVAELTTELESTKANFEAAKERLANYQNIAKSSEDQLADLTAASKKYKEETASTLERLKKSEQDQKEAVAELTKDLMTHRGEKEEAETKLKAQIDSLTVQLASAKEDATNAIARMESLESETKRYQMDAKNAQTNYERELALHAEARSSMRDVRSELTSEQTRRETAETQLLSAKRDFEGEKAAMNEMKIKLEENVEEGKSRLNELRSQNKLMHDQMTSLSATVEKIQSEKASQVSGDTAAEENDKQISDLRELLRFKQSECTMLEADLSSAKRESERERTSAELAKKSLEEARSELKILREKSEADINGSKSAKEMAAIRSKLNTAEEQLVLLKESNTTLREQSTKMSKQLKSVQSELSSAKAAVAPSKEKIMSMEVEKASLVAERDSLSREVESWKNRVNSLVTKFNQIDPTEHAQALESIEKLKGECTSLKSLKEKAVAESSNAKGVVTKLNKEVASQKVSIEGFRKALEKANKEKDELVKSSKMNKATNKKIADAQNAAKKAQQETKSAKEEVTALTARIDNFKDMMRKLQQGMKEAKAAEIKNKATEESLQKEIASLKEKLSEAEKSSGADVDEGKAAATSTSTLETEPGSKSGESSRSGISKIVSKVIPAKKTKGKAKVVTAAKEADNQADAEKTPAKKKGKKRKASVPQKNAAPVEAPGAPPQKKFAPAAGGKKEGAGSEVNKSATTTEKPEEVIEEKPSSSQNADKDAEMMAKVGEPTVKENTEKTSDLNALADAAEKAKAKEELAAKKAKEAEATAKKKAEDEASKKKAEEKIAAKKAEIIAKKKKAKEEAILKMKAEKEAAAKKAKEEAMLKMKAEKLKAEQEAAKKKVKEEEDKKSKAENDKKGENATETAQEQTAADSKQEELMKKRMLLKKKKAALLEAKKKKEEASKAKGAKESANSDAKPETTTPKSPLPSVPEEKQAASKPIVFGASATTTPAAAFGVPKTIPLQSEPDGPKPSFFGSASSAKPTFGTVSTSAPAPAKSTFGGVATSAAPSIFGGGGKPSSGTKPAAAAGGGGFLNLTPPGSAGKTPGKFVFGKSANITLTAPSGASPSSAAAKPNPFGQTFGQTANKLGSSPFGAPFGSSPFGGGDASKKRSLDSASDEPDKKKPNTDKDDVAKETSANSDGAAKEA